MTFKMDKERLLASTLLAGIAALSTPVAIGVGATVLSATDARAQDYTSGTLGGRVFDENGAPVSGANVTVVSEGQGFTRTTTTNSAGEFTVPVIPAGRYTVTIASSGFRSTRTPNVAVAPSAQSTYNFELASTATAGGADDEIVITAARQSLAFNETTTGVQIDVQELTSRAPIGQNVLSLALLAPGAVQGGAGARNSAFANQPTLGGGSVAENAFYINGLNITNFDNYFGATLVPFEFYQSVEVKTGGYQAEFGRATGGVVNAVTKSGSNDFMLRLSGNYDDPDLSEQQPRTIADANEFDSNLRQNNTLEIGGPIWKDHLFFYGLAQARDNKIGFASISSGSYNIDRSTDPFYASKIDFNLNDDHRFEVTWFDTTRETERETHPFTPSVGSGGTINWDPAVQTGIVFAEGGESYVGRYTGTFSDFFTLSGAVGINEDADSVLPLDTANSLVVDSRQGNAVVSTQKATSVELVNRERKFYRIDGDFYFDLFGEHHVRAGWDKEELTLLHNTVLPGQDRFTYFRAEADDSYDQPVGQDYIQRQVFISGGTFGQTNEAFYIQDSWDATDNLTINAGIRFDSFNIANADETVFGEFENEAGPRLGFSYDTSGDGTSRIFGSYGRYFLPFAANTAYRMGAEEVYYGEYFQVGDVGNDDNPANDYDPVTGLPLQLGAQILNFDTANTCVATLTGVTNVGVAGCEVTGDGTASLPTSLVATNLQSTYEDEFILGYEQFVGEWKVKLTGMYRDLGRVAEDSAIDAAVLAYCDANNIAGCEDVWTGFHQYVIINPGLDADVILDAPGHPLDGQSISLSAEDLGYPKAERTYTALTLDFERPWDGKWMLQGSYTISRSYGNYEGQAKSDNGQDDVGITTDFDQPGLVDGSRGLLPNHRAHQLKAFGAYAVTDNFTVGANVTVISPRQFGCIGRHRTDPFAPLYGAASWFCSPDGTAANSVQTDRGSVSEGDWLKQVDLSFRYTIPQFGEFDLPGDLTLRADIFNVFNDAAVLGIEERGENTNGSVRFAPANAFGAGVRAYGTPAAYNTARFVRLGFVYEF